MEIVEIVANAFGGWSMKLADGREIGNYGAYADALRVARWNGYDEKKRRIKIIDTP